MSVIMLVTVWYVCPVVRNSGCNDMRCPISCARTAQRGVVYATAPSWSQSSCPSVQFMGITEQHLSSAERRRR